MTDPARYNNPVRAKVVVTASESTWTSHRAYVGLDPAPPWLRVDEGLARAGFQERAALDRWIALTPSDRVLEPHSVRFRDPTDPRGITGRRPAASAARPKPGDVVTMTAAEIGVTIAQLRSRRRGRPEVVARKVAVHCAAAPGITGVDIADALGMSQQGVSALARRHNEDEVRALSTRVLERLTARCQASGGCGTSGD